VLRQTDLGADQTLASQLIEKATPFFPGPVAVAPMP